MIFVEIREWKVYTIHIEMQQSFLFWKREGLLMMIRYKSRGKIHKRRMKLKPCLFACLLLTFLAPIQERFEHRKWNYHLAIWKYSVDNKKGMEAISDKSTAHLEATGKQEINP